MSVIEICPSILSADFANLANSIDVVKSQTDRLHIDVMDGHFAPNISIGPAVVKSLRKASDLYFDCHLMITNPKTYLPNFAEAGANSCSVHVELGQSYTSDRISQMRDLGLDVGVVANPGTPFSEFAPFLGEIDLLLIMSVNPGFSGQSFMPEVLDKVVQARKEVDLLGLDVTIQIDGGIGPKTIAQATKAGARSFVGGNAIFGAPDPLAAAQNLRALATAALQA